MDDAELTRRGKQLAWLLRHEPEAYGLTLDAGGWIEFDVLLAALVEHGTPTTAEQLREVVACDDKRRFTLDPTTGCVRAAQGHSIPIALDLRALEPPRQLFHGTTPAAWATIREQGLHRRARHHVHLSTDPDTAIQVGERRGPALVLAVDAAGMHRDGLAFFRADNGVWLTEIVPPAYLTVAREVDVRDE